MLRNISWQLNVPMIVQNVSLSLKCEQGRRGLLGRGNQRFNVTHNIILVSQTICYRYSSVEYIVIPHNLRHEYDAVRHKDEDIFRTIINTLCDYRVMFLSGNFINCTVPR